VIDPAGSLPHNPQPPDARSTSVMTDRNAQIVDMLLKAHTRNEKLEEDNEAALTELQQLRRKNKALEAELAETRRLLMRAEKAIPVSRSRCVRVWSDLLSFPCL
jgi:predicted  nucleic acid-binding Zn-ribbon protein